LNEITVGRIPLTLVQIDQDFCTLTYGVAPCTAVNPSNKCFNTFKTCQVPEVYDRGSLTLTFGKAQADAPKDLYIIPSLLSVSTSPSTINPTNGNKNISPLGTRAVANIVFQDAPHSDMLVDKYRTGRTYIPLNNGTFWSKWLVRNPYYQNRPIRIYEGYVGQTLAEMQVRNYLIDSINGPDTTGKVSVTAKDPLKLTDKQKAQAPLVTAGELNASITTTSTSLVVKNGITGDYPATGTVRIDDELMTYTGRSEATVGGELLITLTGLTRGTDGSVVSDHDIDTNVQNCLRYTDRFVWEVVYDLLVNYSKIPASFINYADWITEGETWLYSFNVSTLVSQPTGVGELLYELMEQVLFYIWWDERDQLIKLRAIKPYIQSAQLLTDNSNIIADSVNYSTDPKNRVSQVWVYYNQHNRALKVDDEANYKQVSVYADLEVESDDAYGESRIRKVFARWIIGDNQAYNLSVRLLNASKDNPKYLKFRVDAKDRAIWTADVIDVENRSMVDFNGNQTIERYQVLSAQEVVSGEIIEYMTQLFSVRGIRFAFYMGNDAPQYIDATPEQIAGKSAWYANDLGFMPDGSAGWEYQ
jgi:hypothetical protein